MQAGFGIRGAMGASGGGEQRAERLVLAGADIYSYVND